MEHLLPLIIVTLGLVALPGPNVALIIANSVRYGFTYGLCTVAGTTIGVGLQLVLVVIGIGALLELVADILFWVKWAGVGYLIYLGYKSWSAPIEDLSAISAMRASRLKLVYHGILVAVVNPKTLIFNAALLPQFVSSNGSYVLQLGLVAAIFLTILTLGDAVWAGFAGSLRTVMLRFQRLRNRITAGFFIAAGIGLALSDRK